MQYHILVVDDDKQIRTLLSSFFRQHKFIVSTADSIAEAKKAMDIFIYSIVILDVMLPKISGIEFLKQNKIKIPVIVLTALGDVDDRINGLTSGADDYMAKPFEPKELLLRVQNIINRTKSLANLEICAFGKFNFHLLNNSLSCENKVIPITSTECDLLTILTKNLGQVVAREQIQEMLQYNINSRTVDAQIARLRNKLNIYATATDLLQTVRGKGYVLYNKK